MTVTTNPGQTDLFAKKGLQELVATILKETTKQGASSAEVDVGVSKGFTVTVRMGEVETIEYNQDKAIDITVYFGQRTGSASLSDIRPEAIQSAIQAACNIARFTDEDQYAGLAEKELLAFDYPSLDLFHPWHISVEQAIELAKECEAIALAKDKRITNSEGVTVNTVDAWTGYGNTHGFIGVCPQTRHELSCVLIATQGDEMQRDYYYTNACAPEDLDPVTLIANKAVERTVRRLAARRLTTRKAPVIFAADEARGLLGHFVAANQGGNIYRKTSFLVDQIGKPIFPASINLYEQPHLLKTLGSSPFDDDGVTTRANKFINEGRLEMHALGVYSARKLGLRSTGNAGGVHNLLINTGNKDLSALLKLMGTGLLVTEVMGQGINLVTGDYSRGASGFWVEQGEIMFPVEEITIAGTLQDMYAHIVEVGSDIDKRGNIITGSILIENMTIAGN